MFGVQRLAMLAAVAALAACTGGAPPNDAASGAGFSTYDQYAIEQQARDAALSGGDSALPNSGVAPIPVVPPSEEGAATATATGAELLLRGPGISDENSFDAVSERVSIESDRERLAAQRELFQVIEPTALPERPSGDLSIIVEYALATSHPVGQTRYNRSNWRNSQNCNEYSNANEAQRVFLEAGGPERDRRGLDPDGDGYACFWDPSPFRAAVRN